MDPLTQGVLGATVAQSSTRRNRNLKLAAAAGWIGGMAADLDVLIRSGSDPLLSLEYHRHFTHSLAFIPVGGVLVGIFCSLVTRKRHNLRDMVLFSTIGYATHGLLDAFTSYGTQLFQPFADTRFSWDAIAIIDPFYTVPLLIGMFVTLKTCHAKWARWSLLFASLWMAFGAWQHHTLMAAQQALASSRGQHVEHGRVMPLLMGLNKMFSWRSVYKSGDMLYVDGMRYRPFASPEIAAGGAAPYFDAAAFAASLPEGSPLAHDLTRFEWFADGLTTRMPDDPSIIVDMRYSAHGPSLKPLWGIKMDEAHPGKHITRVSFNRLTGD